MDGYWESPAGHRNRQRWRRTNGILISVDAEPQRKGRGDKGFAFRQVAKANRVTLRDPPWWPRAQLALDIHFRTARKQPPKIEKLAKHHLDLLAATTAPAADPGPVLYHDDSQIKLLYVSCHHGWEPATASKPNIFIQCQTRASAIAELEAENELALRWPDPDEEHLDPGLDIHYELHQEVNARGFEEIATEMSLAMAADIRFDLMRQRQDELLRQADRYLGQSLRRNGRRLLTGRLSRRDRILLEAGDPRSARLVDDLHGTNSLRDDLSRLFRVALPPLPQRPGDRTAFIAEAKASCRDYLRRFKVLTPLLVPLRVALLVVPPDPDIAPKEFRKDLDNVALEVMAVVEEHFGPPQEPHLLGNAHVGLRRGYRDEFVEQQWAKNHDRLRSLHPTGVYGFHVIQLARTDTDPAEGWVALVPGHGENLTSYWDEAAWQNERTLDRLEGRF